jgi:hypothetical protein
MEAYFGFLATETDSRDMQGVTIPTSFQGGVYSKEEGSGTHYLASLYIPEMHRVVLAFLMDDQATAGTYQKKQMFLVIRIANTNSKYEYVAFSLPGNLIYTGDFI